MMIKQTAQLAEVDKKIAEKTKQLDKLYEDRRAVINNNYLNDWPDDQRIDVIGQNGNTGEHY